MASIAKSQRRVTFKGDNMDRLMKPPCSTLEFDKNEPVSDLLLQKDTPVILEAASELLAAPSFSGLRRSKRAWVPRHLRQSHLQVSRGPLGPPARGSVEPRLQGLSGALRDKQVFAAPRVHHEKVLLAGGGIKRGYVYGASDRNASYPAENPVRPDDIAATMYQLLGIDPHTEVIGVGDRPLPITTGNAIQDIIG